MSTDEKLTMLKNFLKITGAEQDAELSAYLLFARDEILSWIYSGKTPEGMTDVPEQYEPTQIMACVVAYGLSGAEGQTAHGEPGISRSFEYSTMVSFIRKNVFPHVGVI